MTIDTKFSQLRERARLAWAILRGRDGNLEAHAKRELASSLVLPKSDIDHWMARHLIDMVRVFSVEGHSGFSASFAIAQIGALLRFEPLGPLTGGEDEWCVLDYNADMEAQNKRCGHVFRRADGTAYDSEAVIFREPNGACFTSRHSRADVTFPYTPKRSYANVPFDATEEQKAEAACLALAGALQ
jgi:hypothetical protein